MGIFYWNPFADDVLHQAERKIYAEANEEECSVGMRWQQRTPQGATRVQAAPAGTRPGERRASLRRSLLAVWRRNMFAVAATASRLMKTPSARSRRAVTKTPSSRTKLKFYTESVPAKSQIFTVRSPEAVAR